MVREILTICSAIILLNGAFTAAVFAQQTEIHKLAASDAGTGDWFGRAVAIDAGKAIIGAPDNDDNGQDSGSAYIFDVTTGQEIAKLVPIDNAQGDRFGFATAIDGNIAMVGAIWDDDNGIFSGSTYLFDATTGQQIAKLLAENGDGGSFGYAVAISGTTALIGAPYDDDNGSASGSAYLFNTTTSQQIAKLLPNDGAPDDEFGRAVAINGTTAIDFLKKFERIKLFVVCFLRFSQIVH